VSNFSPSKILVSKSLSNHSRMAKEKLKLNDLKVQSIVTSLEEGQMQTLKGGKEVVGRRRTYTVRWTMVDTRVQADSLGGLSGGN
jgi:hypothetical protein